MFLQELADLGTVTSAEQLRANATAARSMRYPVRLSAFAFELLMAFLKGARLFLPLGTINEHVNLQARGMRRLLYHSIRCSIMQDLASSSLCICWCLVKVFWQHSAGPSTSAHLLCKAHTVHLIVTCACALSLPLLVRAPPRATASGSYELAAMRWL